jgi:hypothetical protein
MAIDNLGELIRRFEPILYFHPDERFFPSDAKRYIERSALWTVNGSPRDDKANWGGSGPGQFPRHPKMAPPLAAAAGEPGPQVDAPPSAGVEEVFLDLAGWRDSKGVSSSSTNDYAHLDDIADLYANLPLKDSRFWYHAEVFDLARLRHLVGFKPNPNVTEAIAALPADSVVLCYYLFFPASDRGLEGCAGDKAKVFEHRAGQWTCIALLLEGTRSEEFGPRTVYEPTWMGMTSRSPGIVNPPHSVDRHFGMVANRWSLVPNVKRVRGQGQPPGEHPLIFVAHQSHGFYLTPGPQAMMPPAGNEQARWTCGEFESIEQQDAELLGPVQAGRAAQSKKNSLFKWFALFGGPLGMFISMIYSGGVGGLANLGGPTPEAEATPPQFDHPPDAGVFGVVIHPEFVTPPNILSGKPVAWPRFGASDMNTKIASNEYSLMLASTTNPFTRPPWLPSDDRKSGFRGLWGNRVTGDPWARRAGMEFPDFWELFLLAYRNAQSAP